MTKSNYPGYEIERFENEGGCCKDNSCTVCQSIVEVDDDATKHKQMCGGATKVQKTEDVQHLDEIN